MEIPELVPLEAAFQNCDRNVGFKALCQDSVGSKGDLQRRYPPILRRQYSIQRSSRTWQKAPLRACRLCTLLLVLPALFICIPVYMRYRVFSGQMYPMGMTDMRLIDSKISTTWCQGQVVKSNTTFNAFVVADSPGMSQQLVPVSMTRTLELDDDMKEYWGFYLLQGSTVTVSACVRWPGASLIMIKGYKHLQECAYIGDDSSEELDELLKAQELGLLSDNGQLNKLLQRIDNPANVPDAMRRHKGGVEFHHPDNAVNDASSSGIPTQDITERDPKELKEILEKLHAIRQAAKLEAQKKYKPPSHLVAVPALHRHRDTNVDKDERKWLSFKDLDGNKEDKMKPTIDKTKDKIIDKLEDNIKDTKVTNIIIDKTTEKTYVEEKSKQDVIKNVVVTTEEIVNNKDNTKIPKYNQIIPESFTLGGVNAKVDEHIPKISNHDYKKEVFSTKFGEHKSKIPESIPEEIEDDIKNEIKPNLGGDAAKETSTPGIKTKKDKNNTNLYNAKVKNEKEQGAVSESSIEVYEEVLKRLQTLGERGNRVLQKLHKAMEEKNTPSESEKAEELDYDLEELDRLSKVLIEAIDEERRRPERAQKRHEARINAKVKRDIFLGGKDFVRELNEDDEARDYAAEEGVQGDGYAEHHERLNETTGFDMSNSEFWSSFSSSEEALLECDGLILNLPLTPHPLCTRDAGDDDRDKAAQRNAVTYRVPANGYYFFVFNSENEVQTNFISVKFDMQKTVYDVARTALRECKNSTEKCQLSLDLFSTQKVVLELPLRDNESLWNEQFVVISECEPRTSIYLVCVIAVPLLIMIFAFQ